MFDLLGQVEWGKLTNWPLKHVNVKNTHSVTKTEISVFGRQALDAERRRSPSLADKVLTNWPHILAHR